MVQASYIEGSWGLGLRYELSRRVGIKRGRGKILEGGGKNYVEGFRVIRRVVFIKGLGLRHKEGHGLGQDS